MHDLSGYKEIQHTADWALEVWAPDLPTLFEQAARGMYALQNMQTLGQGYVEKQIEIVAVDGESLLVKFLSELLYLNEESDLSFDSYEIQISGNDEEGMHLTAVLSCLPIAGQSKEIKAVTYHDLEIVQTGRGVETQIVFDV